MSRIYYVFALLAGMTLIISWSGNPPDGKTGAPGDGLCSDCHSLGGGTQDGSIVVTGFPSTITPSTAYVLTITNSNPNGQAVKAGFQMTVLNSSNNIAGNLTSPSPNSTVTPSGGRQYWEHNPAQNYPGNNMVAWNVTWTSPSGPPDELITYYAAGNVANGNNNSSGDLIVTSTGNGMLDGGAGPLMVEIVDVVDVTCAGGTNGSALADATEGTAPYTYLWSNGQTTAQLMNVGAGSYTVTVTDAAAGTQTASVDINEPDAIVFGIPVITDISCNGLTDGAITASATGGTGVISFQWSSGPNGPTIMNLAAGSYTVTATDGNGCTESESYMVTEPDVVEINLVTLQHESCLGQEDGAITIETFGGTGVLFSEWSNGFIGNTIEDLVPGDYMVTVTDENNCTQTSSYTVNEGGVVVVTLEQMIQVSCNGGNDGSISVSASGGQAPYTFSWSNGDTGPDVTNLAAGNYLVTVSDNVGCEVVKLYVITQPTALLVSVAVTHETGVDANDGTATANVSGGTSDYTYLWSNAETTQMISGLMPGVYMVTVTDANGCTKVGTGQVNAFGCALDVSLGMDIDLCEGDTTTITATVTGETGDITYLWPDGSNLATYEVSSGGEVCVTVTDDAGCQDVGCVMVNGLMFPIITCPVVNESGPGLNDGSIMCDSISGSITYLWSTGETSSGISGLAPGEYCVTMTDVTGCEAVQCFTVQAAGCNMAVTGLVTGVLCAGDNNGAIELMVENAVDSVTFIWSNGETSSMIENLSGGVYTVTVTDEAGCVEEVTFTVTEPGPLVILIDSVTNISSNPGSIFITVEGGSVPYSFSWLLSGTEVSTTEDLEGIIEPGFYTLLVVDLNGCIVQVDSIEVQLMDAVIGIPDIRHLKVYPVPTQEILIIDAEKQITEVLIMGIDGRLQKRIVNPSSNTLQVGDLEAGMYVLRMTDGENWYVARMVK